MRKIAQNFVAFSENLNFKCLGTKSQKEKFIKPDFTVHILRETKKSFDPKVTLQSQKHQTVLIFV